MTANLRTALEPRTNHLLAAPPDAKSSALRRPGEIACIGRERVELLQSTASGDRHAVHALYGRTHRHVGAPLAYRIAEKSGEQPVSSATLHCSEPEGEESSAGQLLQVLATTLKGTASACECGSPPELNTRHTGTQASRSHICSTATCGSTPA
jgi:hypothetical protein